MLSNLTDLLVHELKDLYSAETQLLEALPKMEAAAAEYELKEAFRKHLEETKVHVERLVEAGTKLNVDVTGETCEGMKGLIKEGESMVKLHADSPVKDAALISAAQRVEHYEIAAYGTAVCFAHCSEHSEVQKILEKTLAEEKKTDEALSKLAMGGRSEAGVNQRATADAD